MGNEFVKLKMSVHILFLLLIDLRLFFSFCVDVSVRIESHSLLFNSKADFFFGKMANKSLGGASVFSHIFNLFKLFKHRFFLTYKFEKKNN